MNLIVIILAAGLGTRMKSKKPKVLHPMLGKPMIHYICDVARKLDPSKIVVVTNPVYKEVRESLSQFQVKFAVQQKPLGTANAVKSALSTVDNFKGTMLIINGDTPLLSYKTLRKFLKQHNRQQSSLSILSFKTDKPFSYGRILRDTKRKPCKIIEEKDIVGDQREIKEVNSGIYAFDSRIADLVNMIKKNPKKGEYYLTDILAIALRRSYKCSVFAFGSEEEFYGVNNHSDLLMVEKILQGNIIKGLMNKGVRFLDPDSVMIAPDVKVSPDTLIYPSVYLEGKTTIGKFSTIYPGVRIVNSKIGKNVIVLDNSLIESSKIDDDSIIGPCAHLRPNSVVGKAVKIGNFVELKNTRLSDRVKASHLSYLGDSSIGKDVNIGAGTITCNYNGFNKYRTVIEDGVFVGSDTQLVAPVKIGKNAYIAAGSTITEDVSSHALAISRVRQRELHNWSKKHSRGKK